MKTSTHSYSVGFSSVALSAFALLFTSCSAASPQSTGFGGSGDSSVMHSSSESTDNGSSVAGGNGGSGSSTGGIGTESGRGGTGTRTTGSDTGGAGSGTSTSTRSSSASAASSNTGAPTTVDLIGPGPATCGATNATHGDGFICVLNYPNAGANVIGYWFDYSWASGACGVNFTKPAGNSASNPQVCFSGSGCAATSGGGLGLALCDVHGINVSTWPQLMMLETKSSLSTTMKSPFAGCNPGARMTAVNWTVGSGAIPAGTSVLFDDAADQDLGRVGNLPAGATSATVPATVDTSKLASIKFSVAGSSSMSWNFCLTSLKVSLQ